MSAFPDFLPWQHDLASAWLTQRERFAHAWLIHGMPGIGKQRFALAAAASLLCASPIDGLACGQCQDCQWIRSGNHPDLRRIRPDAVAAEEGIAQSADDAAPATSKNPSREIRIDQLRELGSWFNTATHRGGWRVAVLYPARAMNVISANALLKVLEEPPAHTVFLLVADAPDQLLPTLLSRCRRLPLPVPPVQDSLDWLTGQGVDKPADWLAAASQAPLRAWQMAQDREQACPDWVSDVLRLAASNATNPDLGAVADRLEKIAPEVWIDTLQRLFVDLSLARHQLAPRYFPSLQALEPLAARTSSRNVAEISRWLAEQRAVASHPLNTRLFVHAVLQRVIQACQPATVA